MPALEAEIGRNFAVGTVLFAEGAPVDKLMLLAEGEVRLLRGSGENELCLAVLEPGALFGEAALFNGENADHGAVVTREARLVEIEEERLSRMLAEDPDLGLRLLRRVARRLQEAERLRREWLEKQEGPRVLAVLQAWFERGQLQVDGSVILESRVGAAQLACRAGVGMARARQILARLIDAEVLSRKEQGAWVLSGRGALDDYGEYWSLKLRFDPLESEGLMQLSGLGETEVRTLSERLLSRRLSHRAGRGQAGLFTPLQRYYQLKSRFEFGCCIPTAMGD